MQKNNKKNSVVFVAGFIVLVVLITIITAINVVKASKDRENEPSSRYETIMAFDFENSYPSTPNKVMDNYCYIISYLYSDEIKDEEIPDVVAKSRELLHFKTIANTGLEDQIQSVKNERGIIAGTNSFVTDVVHSNVIIDTQFPNYADCTVTEYTASGDNLVGEYVLQMDNYQWKVYSWTLKGTSTSNGK